MEKRNTILFCKNNLANGTQRVWDALEADSHLEMIVYGCLSNCGKCRHTYFASVNGEIVTGQTVQSFKKALDMCLCLPNE